MDFVSSNLLAGYGILISTAILLILWYINKAKRHRQWLLSSFFLGLGVGPILALIIDNGDVIGNYTILQGRGAAVELAILSGMVWAIASTWLITFKHLPVISSEVSIDWLKVFAFFVALSLCAGLAKWFDISYAIAIVATLGIISILVSVQNHVRLIKSALSALMLGLIALLISFIATYFEPKIINEELFGVVPLNFSLSTIICFAFLALSSPLVSHWWFGQPQQLQVK